MGSTEMEEFSIVIDYEGYPTAILKGHVEVADSGYNSVVYHCVKEESENITDAVNKVLDDRIGFVRSFPG